MPAFFIPSIARSRNSARGASGSGGARHHPCAASHSAGYTRKNAYDVVHRGRHAPRSRAGRADPLATARSDALPIHRGYVKTALLNEMRQAAHREREMGGGPFRVHWLPKTKQMSKRRMNNACTDRRIEMEYVPQPGDDVGNGLDPDMLLITGWLAGELTPGPGRSRRAPARGRRGVLREGVAPRPGLDVAHAREEILAE